MGRYKDDRDLDVEAYIGFNGSGKSTFIKKMLSAYNVGKPQNNRAVFDENESIPEQYYNIKITKQNAQKIITTIHDAQVVLDDIKILFPSPQAMGAFDDFFGRRRSQNNDLALSVHFANRIPNQIGGYISKYFIFYNQQSVKTKQDLIRHDLVDIALKTVNEYVRSKNIKSLNHYAKVFMPNFPFIVIDTFTGKMKKINFK